MRDPYSVLGLSKTASDAEIKKAYRKLAKELHPDANPGDEKVAEKFKEVSAAYALLSNKEMRARYDRGEINADGSEKGFARYQHAGAETGGFSPFGDSFDPEEIFSTFFYYAIWVKIIWKENKTYCITIFYNRYNIFNTFPRSFLTSFITIITNKWNIN